MNTGYAWVLGVLLAGAIAGCADTLNSAWKPATSQVSTPGPGATAAPVARATPTVTPTVAPGVTVRPGGQPSTTPPPVAAAVSFKKDVAPLLSTRCAACHNPTGEAAGDAVLTDARGKATYADVKAEIDGVISTTKRGKMPEGGPRFTSAEVAILQAWKDAGTPDN